MLLPAMQFPLFPTADRAVILYQIASTYHSLAPRTTGEGQGGRREATNKTDLGPKRQSPFCMFNLTAKKVDVEQRSQSGYKPKPDQNELALHQQTQPTSNNSKEESVEPQRLPPYPGRNMREVRKGHHAPIPACLRDTKGPSIHVLGTASWQPALIFLWLTTEEVMSFKATNVRVSYFN